MPDVIVIAGPNGAGKSTLAPALLRDTLQITEFVNADTIAEGLSAFAPETAAFDAGRVMLNRLSELAAEVNTETKGQIIYDKERWKIINQ